MNDIVAFQKAGLPQGADLAGALTNFSSQQPATAPTEDLLRLSREGVWMYGQENIEVEEESQWAVNPYSIHHGLVCWGVGEILGEVMVPFTQAAPMKQDMPEHTYTDPKSKKTVDADWTVQLAVQMKCISGEDAGTQVLYKVNSVGGRRALQALIDEISQNLADEPEKPIAVITFGADHYTHKQYGKIYTPILEVLDMIAVSEDMPEEVEEEGAPQTETVVDDKPAESTQKSKTKTRTRSRG